MGPTGDPGTIVEGEDPERPLTSFQIFPEWMRSHPTDMVQAHSAGPAAHVLRLAGAEEAGRAPMSRLAPAAGTSAQAGATSEGRIWSVGLDAACCLRTRITSTGRIAIWARPKKIIPGVVETVGGDELVVSGDGRAQKSSARAGGDQAPPAIGRGRGESLG
jgi:hypothetical protein